MHLTVGRPRQCIIELTQREGLWPPVNLSSDTRTSLYRIYDQEASPRGSANGAPLNSHVRARAGKALLEHRGQISRMRTLFQ